MKSWMGVALLLIGAVASPIAQAQGKAEGAVVIRDTAKDGTAPVYKSEEGDTIENQAERGDCVAGVTTMGLTKQYQFERKPNGRVHIIYFANKEQSGVQHTAWMDEKDLAVFTYSCGCGYGRHRRRGGTNEEECSPLAMSGFGKRTWNTCFKEGRDAKLAEVQTKWSAATQPASATNRASTSGEKALTNDDILSLIKVGIGDDIVVSKIRQASAVAFDTSADELVRLKKGGASSNVLDAIMKRAAQPIEKK